MDTEYISFIKEIDGNGRVVVEPLRIPTTKDEALVAVKALQFYEASNPKAYLRLKDAELFFNLLEKLLSE